MLDHEEESGNTAAEEENYSPDKEIDDRLKKGAEQLAEIIKDPSKEERIRKVIELELSGEIGAFTFDNLTQGLEENNIDEDVLYIIMSGIGVADLADYLTQNFEISEDVLTFLKDLNLLYSRRALLAYNYGTRKDDWVSSNFELTITMDNESRLSMELVKGNGEIVQIKGDPESFFNLIGTISGVLTGLDLTISDETREEFENNINTLIDNLKGINE